MPTQPPVASAATIGFFDGVHRGHQFLIAQLRQLAASRGLASMVVTFANHPRTVVSTDWQPSLLSSPSEKRQLLAATGVDRLEVLQFDRQMASLSAREFMQRVLLGQLGVRLLLIGYDNRFGHNRDEGFADYVRHGLDLGIEVVQARPLIESGVGISSSLVRRQLAQGDVAAAAHCLGRSYSLSGRVVGGEHIGRQLGFPTANLQLSDPHRLVPATGAYAVLAAVEGEPCPLQGMMNIGTRPTFDGHSRTLEVHLFRFQGDLYGRRLSVSFISRLRGEVAFASPQELQAQLQRDALQAQTVLTSVSSPSSSSSTSPSPQSISQ